MGPRVVALLATLLVLINLAPSFASFSLPSPWVYSCRNNTCIREMRDGLQEDIQTLTTCQLTCGQYGPLWPRPTGTTKLGKKVSFFLPHHLEVRSNRVANPEVKNLLDQAIEVFKNNVRLTLPEEKRDMNVTKPHLRKLAEHRVGVAVEVSGHITDLGLHTSEAYILVVRTRGAVTNATILAANFFGARHGLETLAQFIDHDEISGALQILSTADISDSPAFTYRGVMIDTGRNFLTVDTIKRTIDGLAANKLNVLHWHLSDTQAFPIYVDRLPQLAYYGAYSSRQVYYPTEVRDIVQYGLVRGVRVLPEFDAPGRVGAGWQWGEKKDLGKLALCMDEEPWEMFCDQRPCGQLNVVNDNLYNILDELYKHLVGIFKITDLYHFGGSEVNFHCWNTSNEIVQWLEGAGWNRTEDSFFKLWSDFLAKTYGLVTQNLGGELVSGLIRSSRLTEISQTKLKEHLDNKQFIVQIESSQLESVADHLQKGFKVIFSNSDAWDLDCGSGRRYGGNQDGPCDKRRGWEVVYNNRPDRIARNATGKDYSKQILGGEAVLWSDLVDDSSLDGSLWPRASALAERLWSNPFTGSSHARSRFHQSRQRLVQRGLQPGGIQSEWCLQNVGSCYWNEE